MVCKMCWGKTWWGIRIQKGEELDINLPRGNKLENEILKRQIMLILKQWLYQWGHTWVIHY